MKISAVVELQKDDSFPYTPDDAAAQVLAALGGNPAKDSCIVTVSMQPTSGEAGRPSGPPTVPLPIE